MPQPESATGDTPARDPRREILAAASSLLYEGGAEGLTIRRLALRCGYTAPAIYQIFGDKAGLLDAILREAIANLTTRLSELPEQSDQSALMRTQFKEIVRFGREHPTHFRLMEALTPDQVLPIPNATATRQRLEEQVHVFARTGVFGRIDGEVFQQAIWALMHGLIALPALRPDVPWREGLEDIAFDAMLAGLMKVGGSGESK
jgi:AcrR family transcriptional regulator